MAVLMMIHSLWRWLVLAAALLAVAGAVTGRPGGRPARPGGSKGWAARAGRIYAVALDIQVLIGLVLWIGRGWWQGAPFYAYTHPILMLLATGLAHMGRSRERRAGSPRAGLLAYAGSLLLLLLGVPWSG